VAIEVTGALGFGDVLALIKELVLHIAVHFALGVIPTLGVPRH
jgi:hypothetical protein